MLVFAGVPLVVAVLATWVALNASRANRWRMRLPGQLEGPDWYIRVLAILIAAFTFTMAVLVLIFGKST